MARSEKELQVLWGEGRAEGVPVRFCEAEPSARVNANSFNANLTKIRYDLRKFYLAPNFRLYRLTTKFSLYIYTVARRSLAV